MKTHQLIAALLAACLTGLLIVSMAMAEKTLTESEVPPAVLTAFKAAYPNATAVKFEEETEHGAQVYEVEFTNDGKPWEVEYTADGKVLKTEQDD